MTEDQKLDFILAGLQELKGGMAGTQEHLKKIDMRLDRIEGHMDRMEQRMDSMEQRMDSLENIVSKNYYLTEEFYVSQKEMNVESQAEFRIIHGTLDMHARQISRNTSLLREYNLS